MSKEERQDAVFRIAYATTALSALALFGLGGAEAYVRWTVNQNFTFLGADGIPALAFLLAVQIAALLYSQKQ